MLCDGMPYWSLVQSAQEAMSIASSLPQSRGFSSEAMSQQPLMQTPSQAAATHLAGKLQAFSKSLSPSSTAIGLPTLSAPSQAKMAATVTTHSQGRRALCVCVCR